MFGMPARTQGDLNFRLLGIPVRVAPWFWLVAVMLGLGGRRDPTSLILWVAAVFFSILVHEFGHGLMARAFGFRPEIVLYGMGGLCASEAERQTSNQRLAVLISGPLAQFLLLGLVCLFGRFSLGVSFPQCVELARMYLGLPVGDKFAAGHLGLTLATANQTTESLFESLFFINLLWPLLNLLPIWPLDGGQIACELLARVNRYDGRRWGHLVSMLTAAGVAIYLVYKRQGNFEEFGLLQILFFVSFAFTNYQILQLYHQHMVARADEDPDWWTRS